MFRLSKQNIQVSLNKNNTFFMIWCFVASFGAYFAMYAFRKPFSAALFENDTDIFLTTKAFLIIAQVLGYMVSKFIGIKVISELKASKRVILIIGLILFAEVALLFFGVVPLSFKFIFLFLNGLPLGMVWGIVFSFLEGRRVTEFIASGLCISAIVSSGFLKSIGRYTIEELGISEYWMPALIGLVFIPVFLIFVGMLSLIPPPTPTDIKLKRKRVPMDSKARAHFLKKYGVGVFLLVFAYAMLSIFRDFRDNFSVELWQIMDSSASLSIYLETETIIGVFVVLFMGVLTLFKNNKNGVFATYALIGFGFLLLIGSTVLFQSHTITPYAWMVASGAGLYLAYVPFQVVIYEKLIAWLDAKGNAGFLMYLSDSTGYLLAVGILSLTELVDREINWLDFMVKAAYFTGIFGIMQLALSFIYFKRKSSEKENIVLSYEKQ